MAAPSLGPDILATVPLGFDWENRLYYASDYFEHLYRFAARLVEAGGPQKTSLFWGVQWSREFVGKESAGD